MQDTWHNLLFPIWLFSLFLGCFLMSKFAFIEHRDSIVGQQAYIHGSSLAVWEVAMILRAYDGDIQKAAEHLHWHTDRIQAAADYTAAFPAEIEAAIADNDSYDAEKVRRMLPQTRVFTMSGDTLVEEMPPQSEPNH